jgi:hypothetical protein
MTGCSTLQLALLDLACQTIDSIPQLVVAGSPCVILGLMRPGGTWCHWWTGSEGRGNGRGWARVRKLVKRLILVEGALQLRILPFQFLNPRLGLLELGNVNDLVLLEQSIQLNLRPLLIARVSVIHLIRALLLMSAFRAHGSGGVGSHQL